MFPSPWQEFSGGGVNGGSIGVAARSKCPQNAEFSMSETAAPAQTSPAQEADITSALGRRSLVLVGMMGAGKSTIGRRLAARLGLPFFDADIEIEVAHAGMTIPEIFATHGEPLFSGRRGAGDRTAARWRSGRDRHRRRRIHARGDPQPHPRQGGLDLAQGGCRRDHEAGQAPRRSAAAADRGSGCDRQPPARSAGAGLSHRRPDDQFARRAARPRRRRMYRCPARPAVRRARLLPSRQPTGSALRHDCATETFRRYHGRRRARRPRL